MLFVRVPSHDGVMQWFAKITITLPRTASATNADAFTTAKTKAPYTERTTTGGYTTVVLLFLSLVLAISELSRWWNPVPINGFSVEKGVSHQLQINLDIVLPMHCSDIHINVQDASGDRILAGDMLTKDNTAWGHWVDYNGKKNKLQHEFDQGGGAWEKGIEDDSHAAHVVGEVGGARRKRKWPKTPRLWGEGGSCRVYGSLEGNKVQGDFHITARGHGYMEIGEHLDHRGKWRCLLITDCHERPLHATLLAPVHFFHDNVTDLPFCSFQLLSPHYSSLLRTSLPISSEPSLRYPRDNTTQLSQVPVLPFRRTYGLLNLIFCAPPLSLSRISTESLQ